jgi:hypothetical protein
LFLSQLNRNLMSVRFMNSLYVVRKRRVGCLV